ncbi:Uu.00g036500.m01.CDS01 [Anthostomella pinea]|uniref:Uu.00g036500.m01.CDS01 n=1 Tax=Anthostomella pinea TaxID=933095 RepID=A0AAI8V9Y9_9PEZI|nr:Uu.00g036500.m01.CDS01 [Anthostomella pinea]
MTPTTSPVETSSANTYDFSCLTGFFVDHVEVAKVSPGSLVATQPGLGLLGRSYETDTSPSDSRPQWTRFAAYVKHLNQVSPPAESYKVIYLVRHGLGVHNIAMSKYGGEAWKTKWSHMDGDGEGNVWADAQLVEEGIRQAQKLSQIWFDEAKKDKVALPESLYTSPLARCLHTTKLVFQPVMEANQREFHPIIKELLRERLTDHTCDKRSSRFWIQQNYPEYIIEPGFEEDDTLWKPHSNKPEEAEEHFARKQRLLNDIFEHDKSQFISLTNHSYAITAILVTVKAPKFRVCEGTIVPLFVKAVRTKEKTV